MEVHQQKGDNMSGSQAIRQDDRYLNEHGQMVMPVPPYNEMDEIDLYQCDNCKEWFKAGDTFVTGGSGEFCYNEPCRKLQECEE